MPHSPHTPGQTGRKSYRAATAPIRILNFNTPAGWEHYMRDLAEVLSSGDPTPERIGAVAARYDFRPV